MTKDQVLKMEIGDPVWVVIGDQRKLCRLDAVHMRKFSVCVDLRSEVRFITVFVEDAFEKESEAIQWQIEKKQKEIEALNLLLEQKLEEEEASKKGN